MSQNSHGAEDRITLCPEECKRLIEEAKLLKDGMLQKSHLQLDITIVLWVRQDKVASGPACQTVAITGGKAS